MNESAIVIYHEFDDRMGRTLVDMTLGTPSSVVFDFERIWAFIKRRKKENNFDMSHLEFIHVHPRAFGAQYSSTDYNCVKGFMQAFGLMKGREEDNPFRFSIVAFANDDPFDLTANKTVYVPAIIPYVTKEMEETGVSKLHLIANRVTEGFGYKDSFMASLKLLSYRGIMPPENEEEFPTHRLAARRITGLTF